MKEWLLAEAEADEKESIDLTPPPSAGNPKWFFFPMPRGSDFLTFLKMPLLFCGIYSKNIYIYTCTFFVQEDFLFVKRWSFFFFGMFWNYPQLVKVTFFHDSSIFSRESL